MGGRGRNDIARGDDGGGQMLKWLTNLNAALNCSDEGHEEAAEAAAAAAAAAAEAAAGGGRA